MGSAVITSAITGIKTLYQKLFPESNSAAMSSLTLDAQVLASIRNADQLTRQFMPLLGTAQPALVISEPKPTAPLTNNSFGLSGNVTLFKGQLPCTLNATFSEGDNGAIALSMELIPTVAEIALLDLLVNCGLVPVNYIDQNQFPAMKLVDVQLQFDSQQQSLKVSSGGSHFPLATTFTPLKGLLPHQVGLSLEVSLDAGTLLKNVQGHFAGTLQEDAAYQARVQFPLGLMNSWQLTLQSTNSSDYPLPDSIAPLLKPLLQSLSEHLPMVADQHLQLDGLHAQFFQAAKVPFIYGMNASFVSKQACEVLPDLLTLIQPEINVSARGPEFNFNGQLSAMGRFGGAGTTDGFDAQVTLHLPPGSNTLNFDAALYEQSVSWEMVKQVFSLPHSSEPLTLNGPHKANLASLALGVQTSTAANELTNLSIRLGYAQVLQMSNTIQLQPGASLGFFYKSKNKQLVLSQGNLSGLTVSQPEQPEAKASYVCDAEGDSWQAQPLEPLPSRSHAPGFVPGGKKHAQPELSVPEVTLPVLLSALYKGWHSGASITLDSAHKVPERITKTFKTFFGATNSGLVINNVTSKPQSANNSFTISGATTSAFNGTSCNVTATFTRPDSKIVLVLELTPTGRETKLSDLLGKKYGIIPPSLTKGVFYPPLSLPGIHFTFDSRKPSLNTSTGSLTTLIESSSVFTKLPASVKKEVKKILPANLILDLDIGLDPTTSLRNFQIILSGDVTIGSSSIFHVQLGMPLGLLTCWQVQIYQTGSGSVGDSRNSTNPVGQLLPSSYGDLAKSLPTIPLEDIFLQGFNASFFLKPSTFAQCFDVGVAVSSKGLEKLNREIKNQLGKHDVLSIDGLSFYLFAQKKSSGKGFEYNTQIQGQAFIGPKSSGFPAQISAIWQKPVTNITISAQDITLKGIWDTLAKALGIDKSILPPGIHALDALTLSAVQLSTNYTSTTKKFGLQAVYLTLTYEENLFPPWFDNVYLQAGASIRLALNKNSTKLELDFASVEGTLVFGQTQVGVVLSQPAKGAGWGLAITSDKIILPSISELAAFAGGGTLERLLPAGIRNTSNFTLANLNIDLHTQKPYLRNLSFLLSYSNTSAKWVLIPGYLDVDSFAVSAEVSPQADGKEAFTGYVNGVVTIAGVGILLQANKDTAQGPWVFKGNTIGTIDVDLPKIAQHFDLPQSILTALPNLTIETLTVTAVPQTGAFSVAVDITIAPDWPFTKLSLTTIDFTISRTKTNIDANITGALALGETGTGLHPAMLDLTADYDSTDVWSFSGNIEAGSGVTVKYLLDTYIDSSLPAPNLTIKQLAFTGNPKDKKYTFTIGCDWDIDLSDFDLGKLPTTATAEIVYDDNKTPKYEGSSITGTLDFHGIQLSVGMVIATSPSYTFTFLEVTGVLNPSQHTVTFSLQNQSVGSMVTMLVTAATGDNITLPEPWSALNSVVLNDFKLTFASPTTGDHTVTLDCDVDLDLKIANIKSFGLVYNKSKPQGQRVKVNLTGTFLRLSMDSGSNKQKFNEWYADDPNSAPTLPGKGNKLFELNLLGLGQHVALPSGTDTMQQALSELRDTFKHPGAPSGVTYNEKTGWLIATQFTLLDKIELSILFEDPKLYGLLINIIGGKFKGLKFEILYRKINDTVGVYYIEFALPNYMRHLQFGEVSITLPDLGIWIYTNGGFKIDLGFPYHDDFSQSGGVQVFPFVGAGGFYFGVLHGQTSSQLPAITVDQGGNFNPVIVFGLGLQIGVGKSINKGPVSAEIKLAIEGILEGTLAPFHPYDPKIIKQTTETERFYYYLKAEVGIVGRVTGQLNLAIITARVNLVARVIATAIIEAHRSIDLSLVASVTISVSVSIDCGLFTIHFTLHFDFRISEHFTLGHNTLGPWDKGYLSNLPNVTQPALNDVQFSGAKSTKVIPSMNWKAPAPSRPVQTIDLYYMYKLTLAAVDQEGAVEKEVQLESLLLIDAPSATEKVKEETSFGELADALLLWAFNAFLDPASSIEGIRNTKLTYDDLLGIQNYFDQQENGVPAQTISPDDITFFFEHYLNLKLHAAMETPALADKTLSVFPMLPYLELETANETIDYGEPKCDREYFQRIRKTFEDWT